MKKINEAANMMPFKITVFLATFLFYITPARMANQPEINVDEKSAAIPFSLRDVYYHFTLHPHVFNGTWVSPTEILYYDGPNYNTVMLDVKTLEKTLLICNADLKFSSITVELSPRKKFLLIGYEARSVYRHSIRMKVIVYDIMRGIFHKLANDEYISLAQWSPIGDSLVYVLNNDIYYVRFDRASFDVRRLTTSGIPDIIFNGIPDWVYEEEVLASSKALWFSPDGRYLTFATFNDSNVEDFSLPYYGLPGSFEYQYPKERKMKYPKAGTPNPVVSLNLIDLSNPLSSSINLKPPTDVIGQDVILYTVGWINNNSVNVFWINRIQNHGQMVAYDVEGKASNLLELREDKGWLEIPTFFFHNNYLVMLKYQDSHTPAGEFIHVTRFDYVNGVLSGETDMSPGALSVVELVGLHPGNSRIYYFGTAPGKPTQRYLYSVPLNASEEPTCISCNITTPEGNVCTYASASFSTDKSHYALSCEGPDVLTVGIYNVDGDKLLVWQDNEPLREELKKRLRPTTKYLDVRMNNFTSKVKLLLPPGFNESKSYPILLQVYGGPNKAKITERAEVGLHSYMTTNRNIIYAWIDGRGSAFKGNKMLFEIYKQLGVVEVKDFIDVTKFLQKEFSWIDSSRTAIWGSSYGGFSTAKVLATDKESVFKCGISVTPATSIFYYDSIYTERYMGMQKDNMEAYNLTDIPNSVEGFRNKKFLLIHGTGDYHVHYQHSLMLSKALALADIPFEQMIYTDETHGLANVRPHLYHTMDNFWTRCLDLPEPHEPQ